LSETLLLIKAGDKSDGRYLFGFPAHIRQPSESFAASRC